MRVTVFGAAGQVGLANSGVRLLVVGGAASLTVPGAGGSTVADDPNLVPAGWRAMALASAEQLDALRAETDLDWAYLSPAAQLVPGEPTGTYRLGGDELLVDTQGNSRISREDLAVALLDEAERPTHHRTRFTVAYRSRLAHRPAVGRAIGPSAA